jgi:hypothetical protein
MLFYPSGLMLLAKITRRYAMFRLSEFSGAYIYANGTQAFNFMIEADPRTHFWGEVNVNSASIGE